MEMRAIFCCRAANPSPPPEEQRVSAFPTSGSSSIISDAIHDDSTALQDIFGPTSSIRGYRAAAAASSPDRQNPVTTEVKSTTRGTGRSSPIKLQASKVRLRLSKSKLLKPPSKGASVSKGNYEISRPTKPNATPPIRLDDILADRSVSQGGYDSDAKNVDSHNVSQPQPTESKAAGTIDISPEYLAKVLTSLDGSTTRTPSMSRPRGKTPDKGLHPQSTSPNTLRSDDVIGDRNSEAARRRSRSSPEIPSTPTRPPNSKVIDIGGDESPIDALHRYSTHHNVPPYSKTIDLQAPRLPSLDSGQQDWKISFAAPRRTSSLKSSPERNQNTAPLHSMKVEELAASPRESIASLNVDPRFSVISSLNDSLMAQMNSFWSSESPERGQTETGPSFRPDEVSTRIRPQGTSPPRSARTIDSNLTSSGVAEGHNTNDRNITSTALSDSDNKSVHLFNMRISQRLASNSLNPVRSPSVSNRGTAAQTRHTSISSTKSPLSACVPGVATGSHVRQISNTSSANSRRLYPSWKIRKQIVDDSSSVYTSKEPPDSDSEYIHSRSVSNAGQYRSKPVEDASQMQVPIPANFPRTETMSDLSNVVESCWLRRNTTETFRSSTDSYRAREIEAAEQRHGQKTRISTTPKESKFIEDFHIEKSATQLQPPGFPLHHPASDTPRKPAQLYSEYGNSSAALSQMSSRSGSAISNKREESAAEIWEKTLKAARKERQFDSERSWASTLDLPGWSNQRKTPSSTSGLLSRVDSSMFLKSRKPTGGAFNSIRYLKKTPPMSWARFPSHTRIDRNEHAKAVDQTETRDFCAPVLDVPLPQKLPRIQYKPNKLSWRLHKPKKSRSMTFTKLNAKKVIRQYAGLFRSQSSDLRRLRAGHRSSISAGGVVEYPELEMIPGYQYQSSLGRAADGSSDDYRCSSTFREAITFPRKAKWRENSKVGLLFRENSITTPLWVDPISEHTEIGSSLPRASRSTPNLMSLYSEEFGTPVGSATAWGRLYADCVVEPPPGSPTGTRTVKSATEDYVSVTLSDRDERSIDGEGLEGRLLSSELRSSTVDFKEMMRAEENKAKEGLLRAVEGLG